MANTEHSERIERAKAQVRQRQAAGMGGSNLAYCGALEFEVRDAEQELRGAVEAAAELARALRLTQEYVGEELLPPLPGWSWFDALQAHGHYETGGQYGTQSPHDSGESTA